MEGSGKKVSQVHMVTRSSGLKTLTRSIGKRRHSSIARQAMRNRKIRKQILRLLKADIQKEMTLMSALKTGSVLRDSSVNAVKKFTFEAVDSDLEKYAPTLFSVLKGYVEVKRRKCATACKKARRSNQPSNSTILGMCASILLRHKNANMNLFQRVVSVLLNAGHVSKQVELEVFLFMYNKLLDNVCATSIISTPLCRL